MTSDRYLVGDVGGTNHDLAAVEISAGEIEILYKENRKTRGDQDFSSSVNDFLENLHREEGIRVESACFAVAGPVEDQRVEMPNADLTIDAARLEEETELENVHVINDFDAIGYAVNILEPEDYRTIQEGKEQGKKPMAVIGAGTGLGKNLLIYDEQTGAYLPHSSEGGHADLPLTSDQELELARQIKEEHGIETEVSYENVLSGQGLENIYSFLHSDYPGEEEDLSAEEVSKTREENPCSRETFDKFIEFYARCCRNYALDTLPENGLYIAGGIAAENPDEFNQMFLEEFRNASPQFRRILSEIPIRVVTNYEISLKGAARALEIEKR